MKPWAIFLLLLLLAVPAVAADGRWRAEFETGRVLPGANDVRIPNSSGTLFSLADDLPSRGRFFLRARLTLALGERHELSALFAPLSLRASGNLPFTIDFAGQRFAAGTPAGALYRFNSYRLTYRYRLLGTPRLTLWAGLTAKVRDAEIRLEAPGRQATKTDLGFVPLLHLRADWRWSRRHGVLLEADAAAARQGRAEDVALGFYWEPAPRWRLQAGYRLVEGGANVPAVYNFAWLNYLFVSAGFRF